VTATRWIAHRGGAALWPENSLRAFRGALGLGVRALELDVHLTADGGVAVIHDATLDRTTEASGPVAARTAAELRRLRLRSSDGALTDETVPLLEDVLALAAPAGATVLVEVKTPGPSVVYQRTADGAVTAVPGPRYEGLERAVLARIAAAGMRDRVLVMAFNPAVLAAVRAEAAAPATALLVDRAHLEAAGATGVDAVAWAVAAGAAVLGLNHLACDERVVAAAHAAGLALGVYTVNDAERMRALAALGVDVVITDRPDLIPAAA
jgi:glycerophosphoryl diester phosphodiesterase